MRKVMIVRPSSRSKAPKLYSETPDLFALNWMSVRAEGSVTLEWFSSCPASCFGYKTSGNRKERKKKHQRKYTYTITRDRESNFRRNSFTGLKICLPSPWFKKLPKYTILTMLKTQLFLSDQIDAKMATKEQPQNKDPLTLQYPYCQLSINSKTVLGHTIGLQTIAWNSSMPF